MSGDGDPSIVLDPERDVDGQFSDFLAVIHVFRVKDRQPALREAAIISESWKRERYCAWISIPWQYKSGFGMTFPKWVQYAVEITIGLQRIQWHKGFSEKNIQTLLYNLEADAGVFCPVTFSDDLVSDSALAFIDIFNLVKKKIGIEKNIQRSFISSRDNFRPIFTVPRKSSMT